MNEIDPLLRSKILGIDVHKKFVLLKKTLFVIGLFLVTTVVSASTAIEEIPSGYNGTPMQAWDPFLLKEGHIEHLFFGNLFCQSSDGTLSYTKNPSDKKFCKALVFAIGYGFRDTRYSNQLTFRKTPILLPSKDSWDNNYVETPSVAKRGNTYYLAYSAWPKLPKDNKRYQIGLAVLDSENLAKSMMDEAIMFKRLQDAPMIPRNSDPLSGFDRENTQEPSIIFNPKQDRFEIYYVGIRSKIPIKPEEPLTEIDQLAMGRACFNPQFEKILCSLDQLSGPVLINANMPDVQLLDDRYVVVYSDLGRLMSRFAYGYQEVHARSSFDGISWSEPSSLVKLRPDYANESSGIHSAGISLNANGTFTMVYQGWGIFSETNCLQNGSRLMLPLATGKCQQSSIYIFDGNLNQGL